MRQSSRTFALAQGTRRMRQSSRTLSLAQGARRMRQSSRTVTLVQKYKAWRTSLQGFSAGGALLAPPLRRAPLARASRGCLLATITRTSTRPAWSRLYQILTQTGRVLVRVIVREQALSPFVPGSHTNGSGACWGDCLYSNQIINFVLTTITRTSTRPRLYRILVQTG